MGSVLVVNPTWPGCGDAEVEKAGLGSTAQAAEVIYTGPNHAIGEEKRF